MIIRLLETVEVKEVSKTFDGGSHFSVKMESAYSLGRRVYVQVDELAGEGSGFRRGEEMVCILLPLNSICALLNLEDRTRRDCDPEPEVA